MAQTSRADGSSPTVLVIEVLRGNGYTTLSTADGELDTARLQQNRARRLVVLRTNVSKEVISEAKSLRTQGLLVNGG